MKNRFGRRFISHKEFLDYGSDVGLFTDYPPWRLLEFLERHGILTPVARIRFPPEVARHWMKERNPEEDVPEPIEGDTPRLQAASTLHNEIFSDRWSNAAVFGERIHPLDEIAPEHEPFVQTAFCTSAFVSWEEFRTVVLLRDGDEIHDGGDNTRTCYHYWQIFPLAAFLRSGASILYDLNDQALFHELREFRISDAARNSIYVSLNLEARHDLSKIIERASLFNAVAYFEAYRQNALQRHVHNFDPATHRLPLHLSRQYRRRCRALARETLARFGVNPGEILQFIKFQCELWCTAKDRSPAKVADEYRRNIESTISLYRLVTRSSGDRIIAAVGHEGGYFKPILKVIFPHWLDEQRDLAERSLRSWILPAMAGLPVPFAVTDQDITEFCDWIEQERLFQLYWHFKRLLDLGFGDAPIARSATASEAVSYANTVELMANAVLEGRGYPPRGSTLMTKVRKIVSARSPALAQLLLRFKGRTRTDDSTLNRRLAQIDQIRQGGALAPVARLLLKLIVIRNEGSHLGLNGLDRKAIYELLGALVQASLLIWKAQCSSASSKTKRG